MLPDFPAQKDRLLRLWTDYLRQKEREYLGYFATAPSYVHYEGDRWGIKREDGTTSESGYESTELEFSFSIEEIPDLTPEKIRQKLDTVAEEMAKQRIKRILKDIKQAAARVGNAGNRRLTKDVYLEALNAILLSFDKKGNLNPPVLFISPEFKDDVATWEQDPEFVARRREIIERKQEEWRARESRRKLVD
jgi:hypothetical protein